MPKVDGSRRKQSLHWSNVTKTEDGKTKCKYCNIILSPKVERIKKHLENCKKYN